MPLFLFLRLHFTSKTVYLLSLLEKGGMANGKIIIRRFERFDAMYRQSSFLAERVISEMMASFAGRFS